MTGLADKFKTFLSQNKKDLFLTLLVFLMSLASFGLGRLSVLWPEKEPIRIDQPDEIDKSAEGLDQVVPANNFTKPSVPTTSPIPSGQYVASRNGSSFHLLTCPGAKQIKDENKIFFETPAEAKSAGYKPAANCPGLK